MAARNSTAAPRGDLPTLKAVPTKPVVRRLVDFRRDENSTFGSLLALAQEIPSATWDDSIEGYRLSIDRKTRDNLVEQLSQAIEALSDIGKLLARTLTDEGFSELAIKGDPALTAYALHGAIDMVDQLVNAMSELSDATPAGEAPILNTAEAAHG